MKTKMELRQYWVKNETKQGKPHTAALCGVLAWIWMKWLCQRSDNNSVVRMRKGQLFWPKWGTKGHGSRTDDISVGTQGPPAFVFMFTQLFAYPFCLFFWPSKWFSAKSRFVYIPLPFSFMSHVEQVFSSIICRFLCISYCVYFFTKCSYLFVYKSATICLELRLIVYKMQLFV